MLDADGLESILYLHIQIFISGKFCPVVRIFLIIVPFVLVFFLGTLTVQMFYLLGLSSTSFSLSYNYLLWAELYPLKKICWSPCPQYLRMWTCWEIGLLQMKWIKMRTCWIRVDPSGNRTGVLIRRGETQREDQHVMMEAEIGAWYSHKPKMPRLASCPQELGDSCGTDYPSDPTEGANPSHTWISDF